ncbi:hypothetical protein [Synechococcus elongatus]|uniref:Uncharacterized protein n=1 Tax=Synechococcus elongatus (strain ATCC 33912 / PCC 7942 / FACHB-805) TaxID=1140 RepID=Q31RV4_SYNE7|nr:hypothetical protein [Synechococcus elongatus]ABB56215.1 conserved hypothetical protein [Synechococcus elongatus PCC 7942 = FACHB-805]AJD56734.1 hypothetical protein M744_02140 [Synechococcus elongatus UTEX 2973]MBD2588047.1 hypothetical protein [Synechococcus elongatus FACHB-242]MBD2689115.1 hypothetical protein [Synechococcus elongatus FACHB-1061]MBD2707245.1 hypothetical protein [Synechococcus elongatus PCC 7942 = FACHB-805]
MLTPQERQRSLAETAIWIAVLFNLTCNGGGYVYQRRWKAYWLGALIAFLAALGSGSLSGAIAWARTPSVSFEDRATNFAWAALKTGSLGWIAVGLGSAIEAGVTVQRLRRRLAHPSDPIAVSESLPPRS